MKQDNTIKYIALIAVVALGYMYLTQPGGQIQAPASFGGVPVAPVAPATPSDLVKSDRGTLTLSLTNSIDGTGTTSSMLLLDPSQAVMKSGSLDVTATRYALMRLHQEKGLTGFKAFNKEGSPQALSASSGSWSSTLTGKIGDKVLVYTYQDTTPAAAENVSTVQLISLIDFYRETGTWVGQTSEGKDSWPLRNYATYHAYDGTDTERMSYTYADGDSADTDKIITWYTRAAVQGQKCNDCAIYMQAPSNYTSRFKYLRLTDTNGNSVKFDSIAGKAENFVGPINIAATTLPTANTTYDYWYYIGQVPDSLQTEYTSADSNRLTWELKTDTDATDYRIWFYTVQNSGAAIANNGPFEDVGFNVTFVDSSTSAFDGAQT